MFLFHFCVDYITSYIGAHTPLPPYLLSLNQTSNRKGLGNDSGQGESEEEKGEASSSNDSEEEEAPGIREVLKWKQGKLLGKGAYGKVWEGLMDSAQLIAVKEVELDVETTQRAQAVSIYMYVLCVLSRHGGKYFRKYLSIISLSLCLSLCLSLSLSNLKRSNWRLIS